MSTITGAQLVTAEQYFALPNDGRHKELVRGEVVEMNLPGFKHGVICGNVHFVLRQFVSARDLGYVVCNDTGVLTERDPDTVRGADVAYYSYDRVPRDERPDGYAGANPELVCEVLSPEDRWKKVLRKVSEYLEAGVLTVCVFAPAQCKVFVYRADAPAMELNQADDLVLTDVFPFPDATFPVRRFFE